MELLVSRFPPADPPYARDWPRFLFLNHSNAKSGACEVASSYHQLAGWLRRAPPRLLVQHYPNVGRLYLNGTMPWADPPHRVRPKLQFTGPSPVSESVRSLARRLLSAPPMLVGRLGFTESDNAVRISHVNRVPWSSAIAPAPQLAAAAWSQC